jgi:hypothetical protein
MATKREEYFEEQSPEIESRLEDLRRELARRLTPLLGVEIKPEEVPISLLSLADRTSLTMKPVEAVATEILAADQRMRSFDKFMAKNPEELFVDAFFRAAALYAMSRPFFIERFGETRLKIIPRMALLHAMRVFSAAHPEFMDFAKKIFSAPLSMWLKTDVLSTMMEKRAQDLWSSYAGESALPYEPTFQELEAIDPARAVALYNAINKKFDSLEKLGGVNVIVGYGPRGEPLILSSMREGDLVLGNKRIPLMPLAWSKEWNILISTPVNREDWRLVWAALPKMRISLEPKGYVTVLSPNLQEANVTRNVEIVSLGNMHGLIQVDLGEPLAGPGYSGSLLIDEDGNIVGFGRAHWTKGSTNLIFAGPQWLWEILGEAKDNLKQKIVNAEIK